MTTSGTIVFRSTRDELIQGALRLCKAIDPENTGATIPTAAQVTNAAEALNMMVKTWETEGLQLWERKYGVIFPQKAQQVYTLGSPGPGGDHACLSTPVGTGYVKTTLTAAIAIAGTTAALTAISNTGTVGVPAITIATTWNIGIQQSDGTMHWTTVNGAPSGLNVTLTTGPTVACAVGATVFAYLTKLMRPLRILDGFVRQASLNDVPCLMIPRENYNRFGNKYSQGTSIQLYYDPQENTGHLYVYPTTQDVTQQIFIEFQKPIEDFAAAANDFDLPQEWGEALKFNLALRIAPEYGVKKDQYAMIKELATMSFAKLNAWDQENASVFIQPSNWPYLTDSSSSK